MNCTDFKNFGKSPRGQEESLNCGNGDTIALGFSVTNLCLHIRKLPSRKAQAFLHPLTSMAASYPMGPFPYHVPIETALPVTLGALFARWEAR